MNYKDIEYKLDKIVESVHEIDVKVAVLQSEMVDIKNQTKKSKPWLFIKIGGLIIATALMYFSDVKQEKKIKEHKVIAERTYQALDTALGRNGD